MSETAVCSVCKKDVDCVMTISVVGGESSPPICNKCFKKVTDKKLSQLKEETQMPQTAKKNNVTPINPVEITAYSPPIGQAGELWYDPKIAKLIIEIIKSTPEFSWLLKYQILAVLRESLGKKGAKIRKATDYEMMLEHIDIILTISQESWEELSEQGKKALISHELCHVSLDEDGKIIMVDHDFEEFVFIASRFGAWTEPLARAAKQLELFSQKNGLSCSRKPLKSGKSEEETEGEQEKT